MDQSQDDGTPVGDSQTISSTGVPIVEGAHQKYYSPHVESLRWTRHDYV